MEKRLLKEDGIKKGKKWLFSNSMLKRKYRLDSKSKVKFGKPFSTPFFVIRTSENSLQYNRFRFVVSKKIDKRAVVRNKIKRILNSCVENIFEDINKGYDIMFFVRKEILNLSPDEICYTIKEAFAKKGLLK